MTRAEQILRDNYFSSYASTKLTEITEFLYNNVVCNLCNESKKKILEMNRYAVITEIDVSKEEKIVKDLLKNVLAAKTREAIECLSTRHNQKGFLSNSVVKRILNKNKIEAENFEWLPFQRMSTHDYAGIFYYIYTQNGDKKAGRKRIIYEN